MAADIDLGCVVKTVEFDWLLEVSNIAGEEDDGVVELLAIEGILA